MNSVRYLCSNQQIPLSPSALSPPSSAICFPPSCLLSRFLSHPFTCFAFCHQAEKIPLFQTLVVLFHCPYHISAFFTLHALGLSKRHSIMPLIEALLSDSEFCRTLPIATRASFVFSDVSSFSFLLSLCFKSMSMMTISHHFAPLHSVPSGPDHGQHHH